MLSHFSEWKQKHFNLLYFMQKLALTSRDLVSCKVEVTPSSLPSTLPDPPFWCFVRRSWFQGREERRGEGVKNVEGRPVLLVGRAGEKKILIVMLDRICLEAFY